MNLGEAIRTALEYETGVYQLYFDAIGATEDPIAKRIFGALCHEEKYHVAYLRHCLSEWERTGKLNAGELKTAIPAKNAIDKSLRDLRRTTKPNPTFRPELDLLHKALEAEVKTSNFYKEMVRTLDGEGQKLFKRFVEIEEGHEAIVQAEIDSVSQMGFWFDTPEFRLEME
jgi:rubrerythrin